MASPSTLAAPLALKAVRAILVADVTLSAMLAAAPSALGGGPAIYSEQDVPQTGVLFPYVTLLGVSEIEWDTIGEVGSACQVQVKALSTQPNTDEAAAIVSRAKVLLDRKTMSLSGYPSAFCRFESAFSPYTENVAGVAVKHYPATFRISAHKG